MKSTSADCPHALLGIEAVTAITSISKPTVYRLMKAGRFPSSLELVAGGRRVAWKKSDVLAWADDPLGWGDKVNF